MLEIIMSADIELGTHIYINTIRRRNKIIYTRRKLCENNARYRLCI